MRVTDHPILFSAPMVRAILDGSKTQTRRVISLHTCKTHPRASLVWEPLRNPDAPPIEQWEAETLGPKHEGPVVSRIQSGDTLWMREAWAPVDRFFGEELEDPCHIAYRANKMVDYITRTHDGGPLKSVAMDCCQLNWDMVKWKPSIHMPRWASRISLLVTDVRVQRVQEISEEDAAAEGVEIGHGRDLGEILQPNKARFRELWDSLNQKRGYPWKSNPWVFVYTMYNMEAAERKP